MAADLKYKLLEALRYRRDGVYANETIPITCATVDDAESLLLVSQSIPAFKRWKLKLLVRGKVVAETTGESR